MRRPCQTRRLPGAPEPQPGWPLLASPGGLPGPGPAIGAESSESGGAAAPSWGGTGLLAFRVAQTPRGWREQNEDHCLFFLFVCFM